MKFGLLVLVNLVLCEHFKLLEELLELLKLVHHRRGAGSNCKAQFQLASSVQVQLGTEISLIITVRPQPTTPSTPTRQVYLSHF